MSLRDEEFKERVIESLARLETQHSHTSHTIESHGRELHRLSAFQNKIAGVVAVISLVGSAIISLILHWVKTTARDHS